MSKELLYIYYNLKPILPRRLQLWSRNFYVNYKRYKNRDTWPIDLTSDGRPSDFVSWPDNGQFALVLTHDVDTALGHSRCRKLMQMEKNFGFRSSFNFVPERYEVSANLRNELTDNGFEVGVHGLNHDGKLFLSKDIFLSRSKKINQYLKAWNSVGFRAPAMHHNLEWIHQLDIEYDASTFDTDSFEPQSDGCKKIFPFVVKDDSLSHEYIELPYTLPQDFTIFIFFHDYDLKIWREKLDWVVQKGGMVLLNTHPDYMFFDDKKMDYQEYPADLYETFLAYIKKTYAGLYWHALPKHVAKFWKDRNTN